MSKATIVFQSDDADVIKSIDKMNAKMAEMDAKLKQTGNASRQLADVSKSGFDTMALKAHAVAGATMAITAAMKLANAEYEAFLQHQKDAAQAQLGAAPAQAGLIRNLGAMPKAERELILGQLRQVSRDTGVSEKDVYNAASFATAAKGDNTYKTMVDATRMAARLAPDSPEEMRSVSAGLLDMTSLTGTSDVGKNAGFMTAMAAQSRVTDLAKINENLVPAAIGVKGFGGTAEEAAAITDTITSAMKDPTGSVSGTAVVNLAKGLEKMFPSIGNSPMENILAVQNNPALRDRYLKEGNIEAKAYIPVKDLLTKGTETANLLGQNKNLFPSANESEQYAEEFIRQAGDTPLQRAARLDRHYKNAKEQLQIADAESGAASINREGAESVAETAQPGWVRGMVRRFATRWSPSSSAENAIGVAGGAMYEGIKRSVTGKDEDRDYGKEMVEITGRLLEIQKEIRDETRSVKQNQRTSTANIHKEGR